MENNYFDIFDIEASFNVDQKALKQRYFALSKQYHPDFSFHLSTEEQAEMVAKSGEINKALKVLQDKQRTVQYLLTLYGYLEAGQKDQLAPSFLMEMMELNELMMELEFDFNKEQYGEAKLALDSLLDEIDQHINQLNDRHPDDLKEEEWEELKENYFKSRYLLRIKEKMNTLAHPNEKNP